MLIYVIDACDVGRIEETKNELHYLDNHDQLTNMKSILIYCNKMDLPDSLSCSEMAEKLDLNRLLHKGIYSLLVLLKIRVFMKG